MVPTVGAEDHRLAFRVVRPDPAFDAPTAGGVQAVFAVERQQPGIAPEIPAVTEAGRNPADRIGFRAERLFKVDAGRGGGKGKCRQKPE